MDHGFDMEVDEILCWLCAATQLPGKGVVAVAVMLLTEGFRLDRREHILLMPSTLRRYNLTRTTAYRSLESLRSAGLIEVFRNRGESPTASIIYLANNQGPSGVPMSVAKAKE